MEAISDQRMKAIEEEMSRFENEIAVVVPEQTEPLQPPPAPFPFPSSNQHPMHSFPGSQQPHYQHQGPPNYHMQPPPRPHPHLIFNTQPPFNHGHMFPPMARPPHPFSPMFVPPQLRNRAIIPPPRPPMSYGPQYNSNNHLSSSSSSSSSSSQNSKTISAPKVVYSAPPVKNTTPISTPIPLTTTTTTTLTTPTLPSKPPTTTAPTTTATTTTASKSASGDDKTKSSWKRVGEGAADDSNKEVKVAKMEATPKASTTPNNNNNNTKQPSKTTTTTSATKSKTTTPSSKTTTPSTTPSTKPPSSKEPKGAKDNKKKKFVRMAAGTAWEDTSLNEWDPDDFRIFCGDLGNEVTDDVLIRVFNKYPSFQKARVIRDKRTNKTKGYGFASFKDPNDFMTAIKEVNGRYVGNRPIKLKKSCWQDRQMDSVKKREKDKKKLGYK